MKRSAIPASRFRDNEVGQQRVKSSILNLWHTNEVDRFHSPPLPAPMLGLRYASSQPTATDLLFDLGWPQIPFGLVVRKRGIRFKGKSKHAVFVALQALQEVASPGSFGSAPFSRQGRGLLPVGLCQDRSEGLAHRLLGLGVLNGRGIGTGAGSFV